MQCFQGVSQLASDLHAGILILSPELGAGPPIDSSIASRRSERYAYPKSCQPTYQSLILTTVKTVTMLPRTYKPTLFDLYIKSPEPG